VNREGAGAGRNSRNTNRGAEVVASCVAAFYSGSFWMHPSRDQVISRLYRTVRAFYMAELLGYYSPVGALVKVSELVVAALGAFGAVHEEATQYIYINLIPRYNQAPKYDRFKYYFLF